MQMNNYPLNLVFKTLYELAYTTPLFRLRTMQEFLGVMVYGRKVAPSA